jgi:prepilin-type N-terminal cleavage/methylation domain-containing protein
MSHTERSARARGFTLLELLVSMIAVATMMLGIVKFFVLQHRTHAQQEIGNDMEENLRVASSMLGDAIRTTRYGAPKYSLSTWIPWVSGFSANPTRVAGANSTTPDSISVAACFDKRLGTLSAPAVKDTSTVLSVTTDGGVSLTDLLDTNNKRLIQIGESESAWVTAVDAASVTIDTDLSTAGNQPVRVFHPSGAEICRVDVVTYSVDTTTNRLMRDQNQGAGSQVVAEGISNMKITPATRKYTIAFTAIPERGNDPVTGVLPQRTLTTDIWMRN